MARPSETLKEKEMIGFASLTMSKRITKLAGMTLLCGLSLLQLSQADEMGAKRVVANYEREEALFKTLIEAEPDVEAQRELWKTAPDANAFGKALLTQLDGSWDKPWFLDYAPLVLEKAPNYSIQPLAGSANQTPLSVIRKASDKFHFASDGIGRVALALTIDTGPATRQFLEKVERTHPNKEVQGQAALALALLSRELGDGGGVVEFKKQRLNLVRKAIIQSAKVSYDGVTVGEIAQDLLLEFTTLEKGMTAPELLGRDISRNALRLSDYRGKPVILVFWHTRMEAAAGTLAFLKKNEERLGAKGVAVLGVSNEDPNLLREMVKNGVITWPNWVDDQSAFAKIYQVRKYPACWVLDKEGKVQYRGVPGPFAELTAEALLK